MYFYNEENDKLKKVVILKNPQTIFKRLLKCCVFTIKWFLTIILIETKTKENLFYQKCKEKIERKKSRKRTNTMTFFEKFFVGNW